MNPWATSRQSGGVGKIMVVFGTRPEVIKLAPVIHELRVRSEATLVTVSTNQHTEMLRQVLDVFHLQPDYNLGLMEPNQTLFLITEKAVRGLGRIVEAERPDFVLVQGDTTSAFAGALAGFYARAGVGHVEAGLRTGDVWNPYPEEMNRRLISMLADLHFAPTESARKHLLAAGIDDGSILVTGNTVVDALGMIRDLAAASVEGALAGLGCEGRRLIVVTAHRRESFGEPMRAICGALRDICQRVPDVALVFPVHLNPNVRETVYAELSGVRNARLLEPVDYPTMVGLLQRAYLVLTDSGGVQEEAASLGRPTLVLRDKTERMEGVEAGVARLIGTLRETIVHEVMALLADASMSERMRRASDCYGDGQAAARVANAVCRWSRD